MKLLVLSALALSIAAPVAVVHAEDAAPVAASPKLGATVWTSDGKRLGRIDEIRKAKDGTATSVGIIYDSRFVFVPISSLTANEKGFATSLTVKDVSGK